jgi:hypothetical protein
MIYIIGDSHVSIFSGVDNVNGNRIHIQPEYGYCYILENDEIKTLRNRNEFIQEIENVIAIKMGSHTAYNLINKIDKLDRIIKDYKVNKEDTILFHFGEIDIRAHLGFKPSVENAIKECVERYLKVLLHFKNKGYNVGVFAPYASLPNELRYNIGRNYSDSQSRNKLTTKFNTTLKEKVVKNDMIFRDIHKFMLNEDYSSNRIYFKDNIHASKEVLPFIKEALSDLK